MNTCRLVPEGYGGTLRFLTPDEMRDHDDFRYQVHHKVIDLAEDDKLTDAAVLRQVYRLSLRSDSLSEHLHAYIDNGRPDRVLQEEIDYLTERVNNSPETDRDLLEHGIADPLPEHPSSRFHVAVTGLITCVGVYFAIDDNTCFVAHINAYDGRVDPADEDKITDEAGERLRQKVFRLLQFEAARNGWEVNQRVQDTLLLACPYPDWKDEGGNVHRAAGGFVMMGIRDFCGMNPLGSEGFRPNYDGFILDHLRPQWPLMTPTRVEIRRESRTLEALGWHWVPEDDLPPWTLVYEGEDWRIACL